MNYPNFNNHEISTIVAYSISEKICEIARQRFYEEFGNQAPPTRTLNDWRKRFRETLSAMVSSDGTVRHKILDSTMNSERYLQILNEIVLPLMASNRYNQHFLCRMEHRFIGLSTSGNF